MKFDGTVKRASLRADVGWIGSKKSRLVTIMVAVLKLTQVGVAKASGARDNGREGTRQIDPVRSQ